MTIQAQALAAKIAVIATRPDCPHTIQAELLKLVIEATTREVAKDGSLNPAVVLEIKKARDAGMTISEVAELLSLKKRQVDDVWPKRSRLTNDIIARIFELKQTNGEKAANQRISEQLAISSGTVSRVLRGQYVLTDGE